MVKNVLVNPYLDDSLKLLTVLDASRYAPNAFFWAYDTEREDWELWIAGQAFDEKILSDSDSRPSLGIIMAALRQSAVEELDIVTIRLVFSDDPVIISLAKQHNVAPGEKIVKIHGGTLANHYFDGILILRLQVSEIQNHG